MSKVSLDNSSGEDTIVLLIRTVGIPQSANKNIFIEHSVVIL